MDPHEELNLAYILFIDQLISPPPPNARKGGSILYISMKSLQKKGGLKSTILKNIGVKILQLLGVLKEGVKNLILKKNLFEGDQNFTSPCRKRAKERVKILMICHKIYKFYKSENGG